MRILFRGYDSGNKMDKQKRGRRWRLQIIVSKASLRLFFTCQVHTCSSAVLILYEQWRLIHEEKKNSCVARFVVPSGGNGVPFVKNVSEIISTNLVSKRPLVPSCSLPRHSEAARWRVQLHVCTNEALNSTLVPKSFCADKFHCFTKLQNCRKNCL